MEKIIVNGKIEFCEEANKCYDRTFVATLEKSGAFQYGNGTAVTIEWGITSQGKKVETTLIDTRYDTTIRKNEKDFKTWLMKWFYVNYCEHTLTFN